MIEIREFQNADSPVLSDLWCIHYATYRSPPAVNHAIFDQAVSSRLFFDRSRLLIAIDGRETVAWCQWFPGENRVGWLAALCFHTHPNAAAAASLLLRRVERDALTSGFGKIVVGVPCDIGWGYQGLEPIGHGIGVDVADDRTNTLLEAAGYHELKRIDRWEVGTTAYRLPVNRDLLLLQRSTRVQRIATPALEPTVAAMLIQFEREWYSVVDMRRGIPLGSIEVWTSDPEAMVMPSNEAILASWSLPPSSPTETSLKAPGDDTAIRHLIASVIPELTQRRITSLHRCVLTDDTLHAATLIAAGFSRTSVGRLLTKKISH